MNKVLSIIIMGLVMTTAVTAMADVTISPVEAELTVGQTLQFAFEANDADANADVAWSVDDETVGTIDENGVFTAVTAGETFVVVAVGEESATAEVTVDEDDSGQGNSGQGNSGDDTGQEGPGNGDDVALAISPVEAELLVGGTLQFEYELNGADANADVVWSVEDETVGTIDGSGLFTAVAAGETFVVVAVGEESASAEVTVDEDDSGQGNSDDDTGQEGPGNDDDVALAISPVEAELLVGETLQFEYELNGADANADVVWSVDDETVGTIDANGLFTAVAAGETFVVVAVGEESASAEVEVSAEDGDEGDVDGLVIIIPDEAELMVGETLQFEYELNGADANADVVWNVEDETVGTIDANGLFTAVAVGETFVVVAVGEDSASSEVEVGDEDGDDDSDDEDPEFAVYPDEAWTLIGETIQFEVELAGADSNADILWSVEDPEIGTIDESGLFTAVAVGETIVTVTVADMTADAEVDVYLEGPPDESGNIIRVQRERNGKINQFGSAVTEGESIVIGGIPHPFNYLNGMELEFPENSLSDDITITVKIPKFAKVGKKDVTFDNDIVSAVTFEVSVNGEVIEPYYFDEPVTVTLPYKKGLLSNLGIDPTNLGMFYVGQDGNLYREGIRGVELDEDDNEITGQCIHFSDIALTSSTNPVAVEQSVLPEAVTLSQNYPNPFNPVTTISYGLSSSAHVRLSIYNVVGQQVRTLVNDVKSAGTYSVVWDGRDEAGLQMTNGIYIYRLNTGNVTKTRKLMLLK